MSIFSDNISFLRNKKNFSQQQIADHLIITRERYAKYENGRSEPPIEILIRIARFHNLSIDLLLTVDIRKYPIEEMIKLPENRIIFPVMVDQNGNNLIEIVQQKASMGYLNGFSDPEYIEQLPTMSLPFLKNGKYRGFLADGDSMPPFADGSCVIGEYVESLDDLKPGKEYIIVTTDGITYKTLISKNNSMLTVAADNSFYEPYQIPFEDIVEVWKYVRGFLPEDYKPTFGNYQLQELLIEMKNDIKKINDKIYNK